MQEKVLKKQTMCSQHKYLLKKLFIHSEYLHSISTASNIPTQSYDRSLRGREPKTRMKVHLGDKKRSIWKVRAELKKKEIQLYKRN
jgi:hypothetical protein